MQVVLGPHIRKHVTGTRSVRFSEAYGMYTDMQRLLLNVSFQLYKNLPSTTKYRQGLG